MNEAHDKQLELVKDMKVRPNYFFAFQILNPGILKHVREAQSKITEMEPSLTSSLIKPETLHITLGVTTLNTQDDIDKINAGFNAWGKEKGIKYFEEPTSLTFEGFATFGSRVLYADVKRGKDYDKVSCLAKELNELLRSLNLYAEDRNYNPHLTVLKLKNENNRPFYRQKVKKMLDNLSWRTVKFGSQDVVEIQLLSMAEKDKNGYYECIGRYPYNVNCSLSQSREELSVLKSETRSLIHTLAASVLKPEDGSEKSGQ